MDTIGPTPSERCLVTLQRGHDQLVAASFHPRILSRYEVLCLGAATAAVA